MMSLDFPRANRGGLLDGLELVNLPVLSDLLAVEHLPSQHEAQVSGHPIAKTLPHQSRNLLTTMMFLIHL
jgi:hypothetical protein